MTSKKPIIIDLVKVVANPIKKNIANDSPMIVVILFIFIYSSHSFSNHLAIPKNLWSSYLSPINWTPNGKLFSPSSKGSEIHGVPR